MPRDEARALEAAQHPIALSILGTPAGTPGWKTIPSFYQVSTHDEAIDSSARPADGASPTTSYFIRPPARSTHA
jgi:hypothetical protein